MFSSDKDLTDSWTSHENEYLKSIAIPGLFYQLAFDNNYKFKKAYIEYILSWFTNIKNYIYGMRLINRFSLVELFGGHEKLEKLVMICFRLKEVSLNVQLI